MAGDPQEPDDLDVDVVFDDFEEAMRPLADAYLHTDGRALLTGKQPARFDARTLWLWDIFHRRAVPPAEDFDWSNRLPDDLGMMRNDRIGLCTCAGAAHLVQVWTALHGGAEVTISDDDVEDAYKAITLQVNGRAYDPADPSTDTGLTLLDVLKYWRKVGIGGHKIGAFAKISHNDLDEIRAAGRAFGGLYTGAMLPISAQREIGGTWTADPGPDGEPGSWGGHCMALVAGAARADGGGDVKYVTWGKRQDADMAWVAEYADEMYAIISQDWIDGTRPAPSGLDLAALTAYLGQL